MALSFKKCLLFISLRMRSSLVVRASDSQCTSCNGPGFDLSIRRLSGIGGAADETVLNKVRKKNFPQGSRCGRKPAGQHCPQPTTRRGQQPRQRGHHRATPRLRQQVPQLFHLKIFPYTVPYSSTVSSDCLLW